MRRIARGIVKLLVALFGIIQWTPPTWLRRLYGRILTPIGGGIACFFRPALQTRNATLTICLLLIIAFGVWFFLFKPEKRFDAPPLEVSATLLEPGLKRFGDDNPPRPLIVRFDGSASRIAQVDNEIADTRLLHLRPAIKGTWKWDGDTELRFQPDQDWPTSTEFELEIEEGFLRDDILIDKLRFEFTTRPFKASLRGARFVQGEANADSKKVAATVSFSHPVDRKSFEQRVRFTYQNKKGKQERYAFEIDYDKYDSTAYLYSSNIPIPMKDATMNILIAKGVRATSGGVGIEKELERSVTVPGMYSYFRVTNSDLDFVRNDKNETERVLLLSTKVQVHEREIAKNLEIWLLPEEILDRDKDGLPDEEEDDDGDEDSENEDQEGPYHWSAQEVDKRVLARSERIDFEQIPCEREYSKQHSYRIRAPANRFLYARLKKGIKAWGGYVLADTWDTVHRTPPFPQDLSIMYDGAILTTRGDKKLSLAARGIDGIQMVLWRLLPSSLNHFITQTRGRFDKPNFRNYEFDEENVATVFTEKRKLDGSDPSKTQYLGVDFRKYLYSPAGGMAHGLFVLHVRSWDPEDDLTGESEDKRMVLITDMGIIEKRDARGQLHVFVQSIGSGRPKSGAQVEIVGKNGLPLLVKSTNNGGYATFPPLDDFKNEKEPIAIVARFGNDFSFLPVGRADRELNYSRFDVDGEFTKGAPDKLRAYLFSERGIYRPGDPIHIGLVAKASDWKVDIEDIPIQVVFTDPRGLNVFSERRALSKEGLVELILTTEESAPTGVYNLSAYIIKDDKVGDSIGSTSVRVEEFLPDEMRIKTELLPDVGKGWARPTDIRAKVTLQNLYGTPATDRTVQGRINLSARSPVFEGYSDYRFFGAAEAEQSYSQYLTDRVTDENGEAIFNIDLSQYENATYTLTFYAEGFEAGGGRSVSSRSSMMVSPLKYVIGYKQQDGSLRSIHRDSEHKLHFIAVNSKLKQIAAGGLIGILRENRYVSTLVRTNSGTYKYRSVKKQVELKRLKLRIGEDGYDYTLPTNRPGDFVFSIVDKKNCERAAIPFSVAGDANIAGNLERKAKLAISLDRKDYRLGDTIRVSIKAPYTGSGLITIERDKVLAYKWFTTSTKQSVQTIRVPNGVDVNAYVNVAFVRDRNSPEIYLNPLCYAAAPFFITREYRTQRIELEVPKEVKPGEVLKIGYATSSPSKIMVFAVDEGILQVAGHKTPNPLDHFLTKRALEVSTRQIMDMVLPESKSIRNPSTTGAGEEEGEGEDALGANLNPFKRKRELPAVFWSGILDSDSIRQEIRYEVPDYFNGSLRVMAVAVSRDKMGTTDKQVTVKGPFVINPSAPLFAVPGDVFQVSATVANNIEGTGKNARVTCGLETSEHLQVVGQRTMLVQIPEGREKTVRFDVKALSKLGSARLKFEAVHKRGKAELESSLSIRPGSPYTTTLVAGVVRGEKASVPTERNLYDEYQRLAIAVSPLPLALADGLLTYLEKFPHGCTEQIVSQTVPALVLGGHPEFEFDKGVADKAIARTIRMLRARQNDEGAFGFWAANSHVSDFQVVWAVQFLTEASERGVVVPRDITKKALSYLETIAKTDTDSLDEARLRAFAIYVLTRNSKLSTDALSGLRESLDEDGNKGWKKGVIAAYLAATYKLMQDKTEADKLIRGIKLNAPNDSSYAHFYDDQMFRGTMMYLLAKHFPSRLKEVPTTLVEDMAERIAGGCYNTISSATMIYGLEAYAARTAETEMASLRDIRVEAVISDKERQPVALSGNLIARGPFSPNARSIEITSNRSVGVFYQVIVAGFDRDDGGDVELKKGVEIFREIRNTEGNEVKKVALGDEINVTVKLRSVNNTFHGNLAIVDLLPAGFEVMLNRSEGLSISERLRSASSTWSPDYADAREDRVILYGSVGSNIEKFVYRIKPVAKGTYAVPPAFVKSMYDPAVSARTRSSRIEVVEQ